MSEKRSGWQPAMQASLLRIKAGTPDEVGQEVYTIATTWAAAGYIKQANQLLTALWDHKIADLKKFKYAHPGLQVLWALSGQRPASIPFESGNVDKIVTSNWDEMFNPIKWSPVYLSRITNRSWKELDGKDLYVKAILMSFDRNTATRRSSVSDRKEALQAFIAYSKKDHPVGYALFQSTTTAALVAASLGQTEQSKAFIRSWGQGYLQYPENYSLRSLFCDTATAQLLLSGVLAPVWGLTTASVDADLIKTLSVLDRRVKKGPSSMYEDLSLQQLLKRISEQAIKNNEEISAASKASRWLGTDPATAAAIDAAEKRLGVQFPADYRSLLSITNGFHAAGNTAVSLLPVEKTDWLRNLDPELVKIWGEPMSDDDSLRAKDFQRTILVGGLGEEQQFLLVPPNSHHKSWQYWFFASWVPGIEPYTSFRDYLEKELLFLQQR